MCALCCRVWGVAESSAERWYQAGCRTLDDVRTKITHLSAMQQVCACDLVRIACAWVMLFDWAPYNAGMNRFHRLLSESRSQASTAAHVCARLCDSSTVCKQQGMCDWLLVKREM
jgi:hypothetical protein